MRKITFAAVTVALVAGCSSNGGFLGFGGRSEPAADGGGYTMPRSARTAPQYQYDHRYWPPVVEGQAFPPQDMSSD